ncbi:DnaJ protein, putative [Plasmodium ovale wallikeri]|uniref:DnaJ protein, putative n=2 Tax=Plasmodium ovale TaxID=36330 RepID=A0A1A8ZS41_PLAOA|nr:DnaJ protein, putative [Plasmodium ovale wallikeri]SBT47539.1 DnaJ protein, putative [Plasmodium ovale wallikeri]SBT82238.1 DnaJ protein, putative [Plasmodium ovale]
MIETKNIETCEKNGKKHLKDISTNEAGKSGCNGENGTEGPLGRGHNEQHSGMAEGGEGIAQGLEVQNESTTTIDNENNVNSLSGKKNDVRCTEKVERVEDEEEEKEGGDVDGVDDAGGNVGEDELNDLFDDFLKDIENISSNKDRKNEGKKMNKGDAEKEITRILANKNSSPFEIFDLHEEINMDIIKSKYRRLSILIHPDKCKIEKANEAFHILNKAYEDLKKDDIKEQYKTVYETAKKNIIKKLNLKKKKNDINEYLNVKEDEYEITKEVQLLINDECEKLLKEQKEKMEYAQKCKLANLKYVQEQEEEKLKEELRKEEERKLWAERRDERVNNWKSYKKENWKSEKEFVLYKNVGKKKEERTEEEKEKLKKLPINSIAEKNAHKKRRTD